MVFASTSNLWWNFPGSAARSGCISPWVCKQILKEMAYRNAGRSLFFVVMGHLIFRNVSPFLQVMQISQSHCAYKILKTGDTLLNWEIIWTIRSDFAVNELGMTSGGNKVWEEEENKFSTALTMLHIARERMDLDPTLSIPCYNVWQIPKYWLNGCKAQPGFRTKILHEREGFFYFVIFALNWDSNLELKLYLSYRVRYSTQLGQMWTVKTFQACQQVHM